MGIFDGIVGGASGASADAPEILDEFKPGRIFGGLKAGGLKFKLRGNRLITQRGGRARRNRRQVEGVIKNTRRFGRQFQTERRRLGALRQDLLGLRSEVRPGFGRLTQARVKAIERAEEKATGNLREQFGARNVLGSSFAAREEAGLTAEFGEREEEARAQGIIDEIGATLGINQQLLQVGEGQRQVLAGKLQAIQVRLAAVQTKIKTDFAEAGLAANIQANVLDMAERIARAQAGLEAQAAADRGAAGSAFGGLVGTVGGGIIGGAFGGPVGAAIGSSVGGSLLGGGGAQGGLGGSIGKAFE